MWLCCRVKFTLFSPRLYCTELDRDLAFLDAPVSGGVGKAANGTLTVLDWKSSCPCHTTPGYALHNPLCSAYPGVGKAMKTLNSRPYMATFGHSRAVQSELINQQGRPRAALRVGKEQSSN